MDIKNRIKEKLNEVKENEKTYKYGNHDKITTTNNIIIASTITDSESFKVGSKIDPKWLKACGWKIDKGNLPRSYRPGNRSKT